MELGEEGQGKRLEGSEKEVKHSLAVCEGACVFRTSPVRSREVSKALEVGTGRKMTHSFNDQPGTLRAVAESQELLAPVTYVSWRKICPFCLPNGITKFRGGSMSGKSLQVRIC